MIEIIYFMYFFISLLKIIFYINFFLLSICFNLFADCLNLSLTPKAFFGKIGNIIWIAKMKLY